MGIASLVLGIIAFIIAVTFILSPLGVILAVIGLILGIVDAVKKGKTGKPKTVSIVGLVICAIMFIILIVESFLLLVGITVYTSVSDYEDVFSPVSDYEDEEDDYWSNWFNETVANEVEEDVSNSLYNNTDSTNTVANTSVTNDTTSSNIVVSSNVGKASSKSNPLSFNEWGIASIYSSGDYVEVPARVTNITRGEDAAEEVEEYCNSGSSIYRYSEPKDTMEWAVIEYEIDLTGLSSNVSTYLATNISGTGDNTSIRYNGASYIVTTMNMSSGGYDCGKVVSAKFATELPIGCTDYIITLGSSSSTQAYFAGE